MFSGSNNRQEPSSRGGSVTPQHLVSIQYTSTRARITNTDTDTDTFLLLKATNELSYRGACVMIYVEEVLNTFSLPVCQTLGITSYYSLLIIITRMLKHMTVIHCFGIDPIDSIYSRC